MPKPEDPVHRTKHCLKALEERAEREWLKANPPKAPEPPKRDPIAQLEFELNNPPAAGPEGSDND